MLSQTLTKRSGRRVLCSVGNLLRKRFFRVLWLDRLLVHFFLDTEFLGLLLSILLLLLVRLDLRLLLGLLVLRLLLL